MEKRKEEEEEKNGEIKSAKLVQGHVNGLAIYFYIFIIA